MNKILKLTLIVLLIDLIFLYNIKDLFNKQIIKIQGTPIKINLLGAFLSYFFIIISLYWFIIKDKKSLKDAFILGISMYGVYEYTNLALLKNWNIKTTIIDTLWGGILFLISTYIMQNY